MSSNVICVIFCWFSVVLVSFWVTLSIFQFGQRCVSASLLASLTIFFAFFSISFLCHFCVIFHHFTSFIFILCHFMPFFCHFSSFYPTFPLLYPHCSLIFCHFSWHFPAHFSHQFDRPHNASHLWRVHNCPQRICATYSGSTAHQGKDRRVNGAQE